MAHLSEEMAFVLREIGLRISRPLMLAQSVLVKFEDCSVQLPYGLAPRLEKAQVVHRNSGLNRYLSIQ